MTKLYNYLEMQLNNQLLTNVLLLFILPITSPFAKDGIDKLDNQLFIGKNVSWGKPNKTTFVEGLSDQHLFEIFYRLQLSTRLAITPDIQFIINPALNDQQSSIFVYGIRGRISL